jgi:hypothetical protein
LIDSKQVFLYDKYMHMKPHKKATSLFSSISATQKAGALAMIVFLLLFLLLTVVMTDLHEQKYRQLAPGNIAMQVVIDPASSGVVIPPSFVGISTEPGSNPCNILALDQQNPTLVENMFKNLGPGILRIGGESVEHVSWSPGGTYSCSDSNTVQTQSLVNATIAFLRKVGWKVIWGENLKSGNPTAAADEAAYIARIAGPTLLGIEIGNEPNLYGWSYSTYQSKWESIASAIKARGQNIPLVGPGGTDCCADFYTPFLHAESSKLVMATDHYYPTYHTTTFTDLLSPSLMPATISSLQPRLALAQSKHLPYQLDESNAIAAVANDPSYSLGGAFGISLWALDYLFTVAEHGVAGVNIHGFSGDDTSIFDSNDSPRPIYYGMLAFHYAAPNGTLIPLITNTTMNITAHAVVGNDGSLKLIVINKDQSKSVQVQINTTRSYSQATAVRLAAPSVSATTGITLGGTPISFNRAWSPSTGEQVSVSGANSQITLSTGSATIITYSNRQ